MVKVTPCEQKKSHMWAFSLTSIDKSMRNPLIKFRLPLRSERYFHIETFKKADLELDSK